jgi:serine palmitoyltransferase
MPPLLAISASEGINILRSTPSILSALHDNIRIARTILDRVDCITITSHPASPVIHIHVRPASPTTLQVPSPTLPPPGPSKPSNPASAIPRDAPQFDIELEEKLLQDVVDEALAQGVMITRAKRLRGQELVEPRPSIRLALTSALTRKETEKAVGVIKVALVKVLGKRR